MATLIPTSIFSYGVCAKSCPETFGDEVDAVPTTLVPKVDNSYDTVDITGYCAPLLSSPNLPESEKANLEALSSAMSNSQIGSWIADIASAKWTIFTCFLASLVFMFAYIKFMDWCAYWLAWASIVIIQLSLIATGISAYMYKDEYKDDETMTKYCNWIMWGAFIASGLYYICLACGFKSLRVAISVIETAADFFADTKRVILIPIMYFFVALIVFVFWLVAAINVASVGTITVESASF